MLFSAKDNDTPHINQYINANPGYSLRVFPIMTHNAGTTTYPNIIVITLN